MGGCAGGWQTHSSQDACWLTVAAAADEHQTEGLKFGLDFEQALTDPDMVEVIASTQVYACWGTLQQRPRWLPQVPAGGLCPSKHSASADHHAIGDPLSAPALSHTQILIQLKRFNQSAQQALAQRRSSRIPSLGGTASSSGSSGRARTKPAGGSPLDADLGSILGTPNSETAGVDTSIGGECVAAAVSCVGCFDTRMP